jgi:hypothetical protein
VLVVHKALQRLKQNVSETMYQSREKTTEEGSFQGLIHSQRAQAPLERHLGNSMVVVVEILAVVAHVVVASFRAVVSIL